MSDWIALSGRYFRLAWPARSPTSRTAGRRRATTRWCAPPRSPGRSSTASTPQNVVTVPLGVDLDQFHPRRRSAVVRQRWAGPDQTLLVHCGRLSVEKHAHRSIDTVAALQDSGVDARLVVVGEGPLRARLERQAARLPVDFTGYIGCRDTVATILASADVALAPGHTRRSGWPHLKRWPAAPRPSCRERRRLRRFSPPTAARRPTTTRTRSRAP